MVPEAQYVQAREIFGRFKAGLEEHEDVLRELLEAFTLLLAERNTTYHENRFIVGGAVEHIIAAAMRCVGLDEVEAVGFVNDRADITVEGQAFSLKSVFTPGSPIALINTQGDGQAQWTVPTIVVLASNRDRGNNRGIGYADPRLLPADATTRTRDQLRLKRRPLYNVFREQRDYLLRCDVPANPDAAGDALQMTTALSKNVARDIIFRTMEGQSLFSEVSLQQFLQRTAQGVRVFPRLSHCMEQPNDAG